ncbi:type I-E CRISPR-associated protein Cse2/CasB [Chrysiogenes arsenatis]|uniref:type I-E CRISPR-associated protein Cse2/CasB n=1 Tax=Chrysiogenes arsenatis TaxID=309797 RepID=UPI0004032CC0|nr:type I-E CRISPR-associated protein Cse2/CasB [Chrysiogenes arsenatis]
MSSLLKRLQERKNDRGIMANLRCILTPNKRHRAWPALNRLGIPVDDEVAAFIAGLYAMYPEETSTGNLGTACRSIERSRDERRGEDSKLTPTERRFQLLITAESGEELNSRVLRILMLAKSQGVAINYERLLYDLREWPHKRQRVQNEWAREFWAPGAEPLEEGA